MLRKMLWPILVGMMLLTTGCDLFNPIGPIIQIGVIWMNGDVHKYYNTEHEPLIKATKDVLDDLKMPIKSEELDGNVYYIVAGDEGKYRFKIKVTSVRENVTKLSIRVNFVGDRPYAEMIYRHVDEIPGIRQFASVAALNDAVNKRDRMRHKD